MKFTRLRLSGFKSFVEPTELFIEPGLTAIVGPNGCGKSNLFDALRWVMGEARPTSVRGSEMDDVIFAGSAARPSRNTAEVTLFVDNADRSAKAPYNEFEAVEVSRRIEREAGSVYRINGRDTRQRDVQLFFADASSGATSTAFVRQGQISLLISQKPLARRAILEEAAGISGLHQRRHEAELRLRAAETNMGRLDDVIREVEAQAQALKRQARQAARYRNLSGLIRKAEALAMLLRWTAAEAQAKAAKEALDATIAAVEIATEAAALKSTAQAEAASALPQLRDEETGKNAALHRLVLARDALDAEEARAREAAQRFRQRLEQNRNDIQHERTLEADAKSSLAKLAEELAGLTEGSGSAQAALEEAGAHAGKMAKSLSDAETALQRFTDQLAQWNAQQASFIRARDVANALTESTVAQLGQARASLDQALTSATEAPDVQKAEVEVTTAQAGLESVREALSQARDALTHAEAEERAVREPLEFAEMEMQRLSAETKALSELLRPREDLWPPLVDAVQVQAGYEAAFAAALGDDLQAPLDEAAPHHWRDLGAVEIAALPGDVRPLSKFVQAPAALSRLLAATGVVFHDQGAAMQAKLLPGQRLVSPRGDIWRWDGYVASAEAQSPAAIRLAQRNRLAELDGEIAAVKDVRAERFAAYSAAKDRTIALRDEAQGAERSERSAQQDLFTAQNSATSAARAAAERASQLATLEAEVRRLDHARSASLEAAHQAEADLAQLGDGRALTQDAAIARTAAADARGAHIEARAAVESLKREAEQREKRVQAVTEESARWEKRGAQAAQQIVELDRRSGEMAQELQSLEGVPEAIAGKRNALFTAISEAEAARSTAADARAGAENRLNEADKAAKAADAALSTAREERARAQALGEAADARIEELRTRIREELDAGPDELPERAEVKDGHELPPLEQADKRVEKLKQEREQLGGVNLRAEEEAAEAEQRLQTLSAERADLDGAIQRLRRGIQSLNREGRERLLEAFEKVNHNFQMLFAKLFEGGEAKIVLTESEDPLEAGLELFARPPGKRLQSLALLSGGEQALTAMSLIFAVFMVNPAPVCVLDEVDAPLDDANVERFCNLLDEMTRLTDTRFLVITHHALTMSRMHRLFGVTMTERGVSQLVSVSLAEAEQVIAAE